MTITLRLIVLRRPPLTAKVIWRYKSGVAAIQCSFGGLNKGSRWRFRILMRLLSI